MSGHRRGEVVWYPAIFADYDRPFLVLSTDRHPFHGDEYIGLSITKTSFPDALPITTDDWEFGHLPEQSYVKPWNPAILKDDDILSVAGVLREQRVDDATRELATICGL